MAYGHKSILNVFRLLFASFYILFILFCICYCCSCHRMACHPFVLSWIWIQLLRAQSTVGCNFVNKATCFLYSIGRCAASIHFIRNYIEWKASAPIFKRTVSREKKKVLTVPNRKCACFVYQHRSWIGNDSNDGKMYTCEGINVSATANAEFFVFHASSRIISVRLHNIVWMRCHCCSYCYCCSKFCRVTKRDKLYGSQCVCALFSSFILCLPLWFSIFLLFISLDHRYRFGRLFFTLQTLFYILWLCSRFELYKSSEKAYLVV